MVGVIESGQEKLNDEVRNIIPVLGLCIMFHSIHSSVYDKT